MKDILDRIKRVSWPSVFAGFVAGITIGILFF